MSCLSCNQEHSAFWFYVKAKLDVKAKFQNYVRSKFDLNILTLSWDLVLVATSKHTVRFGFVLKQNLMLKQNCKIMLKQNLNLITSLFLGTLLRVLN